MTSIYMWEWILNYDRKICIFLMNLNLHRNLNGKIWIINSCLVNKNRFSFSSDHEIIDVVDAPAKPHPSYDMAKARSLMHECDRHVNFARMEECPDDWEEHISRFKQTSVILQAGPHPLIILISLFWWRITVVYHINQSVHWPFEIICLWTALFIYNRRM